MEKEFVDFINCDEYKIYRSNGYLGLFDSEDKQILPFSYDAFEYDNNIIQNTIIVVHNGKKGVFYISSDDNKPPRLVIPTIYDRIVERVIESPFAEYYYHNSYLFSCYRGSTIDVWDESGMMIYSDIFDEIIFAVERAALFVGVKKFGKCGVVSSDLRQITIPCDFDEILEPINGIDGRVFFKISKNGKWGLVESTLVAPYYNYILPLQYDDVCVTEKYVIVKRNERYAIRDFEKDLTQYDYDSVELFFDSCYTDTNDSPTFVVVSKNQQYYLYQDSTLVEIPGRVKNIYSDKCIVFEKDGLLGIVDHKSKLILNNRYTSITPCSDIDLYYGEVLRPSLFKLNKHGKYGMFSLESNEYVPCIYDSISFDIEDRGHYYAKSKHGFSIYSSRLSCIVPIGYEKYEKIEYKCEMMPYIFYKVYLNGKVGVYSIFGQCVPCAYDSIQIINLFGCYDQSLWLSQEFWFIVTYNGKKGLINIRGEVLIPCICDDMKVSNNLVLSINGVYRSVSLNKVDDVVLNASCDD